MTSKINVINPIEYSCWNELILSNSNCSFFHSSNWAKVLSESYKYTPLYFMMLRNDTLSALIPFMEIDSKLTGKRAVALPFTDCCNPLYQDAEQFSRLMDCSIEYGARHSWKTLKMRTDALFPSSYPPSSIFYGHVLKLSRNEEALFSTFRESTRRNIKKAIKEDVKITISDSMEAIRTFYRLNCITRRDHGIPPQPYRFFEKIHEHIISKGLGIVVLASCGTKSIAGAIYFHFGNTAIFKYGASDKHHQHLRANNYIMYEAIKWYCRGGYHSLHFGRTEPENTGLRQFKIGWGTSEFAINYYTYSIERRAFVPDTLNLTSYYNSLVRKIPLSLNKLAGSLLYRHVG